MLLDQHYLQVTDSSESVECCHPFDTSIDCHLLVMIDGDEMAADYMSAFGAELIDAGLCSADYHCHLRSRHQYQILVLADLLCLDQSDHHLMSHAH